MVLNEAFKVSMEAYLNDSGFDDYFLEIVEREIEIQTLAILSAVAASVDDDKWQDIQEAVEKARQFK